MSNHVYGIIGVIGLLLTLATSFLKNDDLGRWILVASGWAACLIIAIATAWGTRRLTQRIIALEKEHDDLRDLNSEYKSQRDSNLAIATFLTQNGYGTRAKRRIKQDDEGGENANQA